MSPYCPPLERRSQKLRLDFNENLAGCSPKVLEVLRTTPSPGFVATYPEYALAQHKLGHHLGVDGDQVIIGAGTDEMISAVMHAYVDPGDEVIIPTPSFAMFRFYAQLVGGEPVSVPYRQPDLGFPVSELQAAISPRTRVICIASPNNPTGGALGLEQVERILAAADGCAVLIDEAYFDFHGETTLGLIAEWQNLFVARTFSKAYGMAGLRVGVLASLPGNIEVVSKGQSPYGVNSLAIHCAMAAITDQEYVREYVRQVLQSRELLCSAFRELDIHYWPSRANFVLFKVGETAPRVCAALSDRGVLVRDQSHHVAGAVRVTVGPLSETIRFIDVLGEVLSEVLRR